MQKIRNDNNTELAPEYMNDLAHPYEPSRTLRSTSRDLLTVLSYRLETFGGRALANLAPRLWNSLDPVLRRETDVQNFQKLLKTFLFKEHFDA